MVITLNGTPHELTEATTVASLLEKLGLAGKYVAVERNRELVPKRLHSQTELTEGDVVEIVTLVGGG